MGRVASAARSPVDGCRPTRLETRTKEFGVRASRTGVPCANPDGEAKALGAICASLFEWRGAAPARRRRRGRPHGAADDGAVARTARPERW